MTSLNALLPSEHHATRSARIRRAAADRAARYRDAQREQAQTDEAIARAFVLELQAKRRPDGGLVAAESHAEWGRIVGRAAYELGGRDRFEPAKARIIARFAELAPEA